MRLLAAVAFAYLLILLIFRVFEHRLIFFPDYPNRLGGDWRPKGLPVEEVWLRATDGIKLHCWWIAGEGDRKSTRLNSSHGYISYAVFCLKKKKNCKSQCRHDR